MTRLQTGTIQVVNYQNLSGYHIVASPIPANYRSAFADMNWRAAMAEEFQALVDNGTWRLVSCPPGANVVTKSGFTSIHFTQMALLLVTRIAGLFGDSLSSMALTTMRLSVRLSNLVSSWTVLSIPASRQWPIHRLM